MSIQHAEAIVLRSRKQGETSKILTLYTRQFGKVSAMAKGSRGVKSKYLGALETFSYISLVFYRKEQRSLQYLSQATILESFPRLHSELGKLTLAAIPCEIVDKSEETEHPNVPLFQLLLDGLRAIESNTTGLRNVLRAFQLKFIALAGFEPNLHHCHVCGTSEPDVLHYFSLEHGMYTCSACGPMQQGYPINTHALQVLRWFYDTPIQRAGEAQVSKQTGEQIDRYLTDYLQYHIEALSHLKSIRYLQNLQNTFSNSS